MYIYKRDSIYIYIQISKGMVAGSIIRINRVRILVTFKFMINKYSPAIH